MIVIVAGVSGSGKTTVGALLAGRLGWRFADGDDLHPAANVAKMRAGIPLIQLVTTRMVGRGFRPEHLDASLR